MSVRVMSWVWEHSRAEPTDKLVLLAIADCANDAGGDAYPSMARLIAKTGLHERSVQRSLKRLVKAGELVVHTNAGPRGCNRYRLPMRPDEVDSTPGTAPPPAPRRGGSETPRQSDTPAESHSTPGTAPPHPRQAATPTPGTAPPEPSVRPRTIRELSLIADDPFDEFWKIYPRRAGKDDARKAWAKAIKRADPVVIIAGASAYRHDPNRTLEFTKHPATWLNAGCWDDDPLPARNGSRLVEHNGLRLTPETVERMTSDRERLAALDAQEQRRAIGGAT